MMRDQEVGIVVLRLDSYEVLLTSGLSSAIDEP